MFIGQVMLSMAVGGLFGLAVAGAGLGVLGVLAAYIVASATTLLMLATRPALIPSD